MDSHDYRRWLVVLAVLAGTLAWALFVGVRVATHVTEPTDLPASAREVP